jgi:Helix-turn-helix
MRTLSTPSYTVSAKLLARDDFRAACQARDFGAVFKLMSKYDGASQDNIASPVEGLTQSRVSRIMNGKDHITTLGVIEKVAEALRVPGSYFGLAAMEWEQNGDSAAETTQAGSPAPVLAHPTPATPAVPSRAMGDVIDRRVSVDITIAEDGWSTLTYRHELHNDTDAPFTRLARELWFEHTRGPLDLRALSTEDDDRNMIIQRIHDAAGYTKFACQLFPALQPGESTVISYTATGGQFVSDHYWRQSVVRPTDELTLRLHHQGVAGLTGCSAIEERPDGPEISASESLTWRRDGTGVVVELTRRQLRPNQSVTLRWEAPRVPS